MAAINADATVMEFFPGTKSYTETASFVDKMRQQYADNGFCYYAVNVLETGVFIGFIGMMEQTYEAPFTPCVDIGWRLCKEAWGNGYATEGAMRCMKYAFDNLEFTRIYATAPLVNARSQRVMVKAGMRRVMEFVHPLLMDDKRLRDCVLYEIEK